MEKFVVVTGASSGIGRACVSRLLRDGWVVFAGVRKPSDADRLAREGAIPLSLDVTDRASIHAAVQRVGHRLDGLVNNAGIGLSAPIEYVTPESLRLQFEVNVFGQVAVTQAFLPLIREARGRIINMGSVGSHLSIPFGGVLCATKSAFRSLNDALRLELHPFGIHVSMIEPAAIRTPAVDKTLGNVEAVIGELPPEGARRYGKLLREFMQRAYARENNGSPPEVVADVVHRALTATHPRARYPAGKDARLLTAMPRLLPDGILDRIRYRLFGMPA